MTAPVEDEAPIRYYDLQAQIEVLLRYMTDRELEGATIVITAMHSFLDKIHFQEKRELDARTFVKTVEELFEICTEEIIGRELPESEPSSSVDGVSVSESSG